MNAVSNMNYSRIAGLGIKGNVEVLAYQNALPNQPGQLERQAETGPQAQAHQAANEAQHGESQRR